MIDGRGKVRLTDFGIASMTGHLDPVEARHGTPAFMAPEQWTAKEVSIKSDIYSLGLVLYELFTGKRAFTADTAKEMIRLQRDTTPRNPCRPTRGSRKRPSKTRIQETIISGQTRLT